MIQIIYDGNCRITLEGHAGFAPKGRDLVCAAVSGLTLGLKEQAEQAELERGFGVLQGGDPRIYSAFAAGYESLANFFPKYVHYKCLKDEKGE